MIAGIVLPQENIHPRIFSSPLTLGGSRRRFFQKNIPLIAICVLMLAVFGGVLWFSVNEIYQKEASKQHGITVARIENARVLAQSLFAGFSRDLEFVAQLKPFSLMTENWQITPADLEQAGDILRDLLSGHTFYKSATVLGPNEEVLIRVTTDRTDKAVSAILFDHHLERSGPAKSPVTLRQSGESDGARAASSVAPGEGVAEFRLSTHLAGSRSNKGFSLRLVVDLLKLIRLLPENIFLQIDGIGMIERTASGLLRQAPLKIDFSAPSGWIELTPETTLHYRRVDIPPEQKLVIGVRHFHPKLKQTLYWLFVGSLGLLSIFLVLIFYVGYLNVIQYIKKLSAQRAMLFSLAALAEERDPKTGTHLERTRRYALILAQRLAAKPEFRPVITSEYLENLYDSAPLHDIGKVAIPDSILLKPGELTPEEFGIMKTHVTFSRRLLEDAAQRYGLKDPMITIGINIAAYHHERFDGSGYPDGLKGKDIPLEARIFSLCDAYDAIRSDRPYKRGLPHEEAVSRIKADRGKHFDPEIVDAFLECEKAILGISKTLSNAA